MPFLHRFTLTQIFSLFPPYHLSPFTCICVHPEVSSTNSSTSAEHQTYRLCSCIQLQMFHICLYTCYPAKLLSLHGRFTVKKDCSYKQFYDRLTLQASGSLPSVSKAVTIPQSQAIPKPQKPNRIRDL